MQKYWVKFAVISFLLIAVTSAHAQSSIDELLGRIQEQMHMTLELSKSNRVCIDKAANKSDVRACEKLWEKLAKKRGFGEKESEKLYMEMEKALRIEGGSVNQADEPPFDSEENYDDEAEEASFWEEYVWNEDEKREALSEIDWDIESLEHAIPCVKKAKTILDMAECD